MSYQKKTPETQLLVLVNSPQTASSTSKLFTYSQNYKWATNLLVKYQNIDKVIYFHEEDVVNVKTRFLGNSLVTAICSLYVYVIKKVTLSTEVPKGNPEKHISSEPPPAKAKYQLTG